MIHLIPMNLAEFEPFMEISMRDQAAGHVKTGRWKAAEADENMLKLRDQFLPDGLNTPDHFFFTLEDADSGDKIGALWYMLVDQDGQRMFFVMDIQVYPEYRRRGYGAQAFKIMEENALKLGVKTISLHVFKHNHAARAMYEKLGYAGPDEALAKTL